MNSATSWTGRAAWWAAASVSVAANALPDGARYNRDNVVATLTFQDGSIATISYLANGDRAVPKEQFEVFCEGKVGRITDFCTLELAREWKDQAHQVWRKTKDINGRSNSPWTPCARADVRPSRSKNWWKFPKPPRH